MQSKLLARLRGLPVQPFQPPPALSEKRLLYRDPDTSSDPVPKLKRLTNQKRNPDNQAYRSKSTHLRLSQDHPTRRYREQARLQEIRGSLSIEHEGRLKTGSSAQSPTPSYINFSEFISTPKSNRVCSSSLSSGPIKRGQTPPSHLTHLNRYSPKNSMSFLVEGRHVKEEQSEERELTPKTRNEVVSCAMSDVDQEESQELRVVKVRREEDKVVETRNLYNFLLGKIWSKKNALRKRHTNSMNIDQPIVHTRKHSVLHPANKPDRKVKSVVKRYIQVAKLHKRAPSILTSQEDPYQKPVSMAKVDLVEQSHLNPGRAKSAGLRVRV